MSKTELLQRIQELDERLAPLLAEKAELSAMEHQIFMYLPQEDNNRLLVARESKKPRLNAESKKNFSGITIENICIQIKKARIKSRLTQAELALRLSIRPSSFNKIEKGVTRITLEKLQHVAVVLAIPLADLLIGVKSVGTDPVMLPEIDIAKAAFNIRQSREKKKISQDQMAARLLFSQNAYSKIELGYTQITVDHLLRIAAVLEIYPLALLVRDIPHPPHLP